MLRLIKVDFASTRKPHLRNGTPFFFQHLRAFNALLRECSYLVFQTFTHEVKFVRTVVIGRVERGLRKNTRSASGSLLWTIMCAPKIVAPPKKCRNSTQAACSAEMSKTRSH
jgi:hypothetical protein